MNDQPTSNMLGYDGPMSDDGTFDGDTIVCDACYVGLMPFTDSGRALRAELHGEQLKNAIVRYNITHN
jgi:hypothetical protein